MSNYLNNSQINIRCSFIRLTLGNNRLIFIAIGAIIGIGVTFAAVYNIQDQEIQQVSVSAINEEKYLPYGTTSFMYPGEPVPEDEMRVTVFGSGWGFVRPGQADQSIFVELGNGDSFVFDLGEGSEANYMAMHVPYSKMSKLFITHLHMDHMGGIPHMYSFGPVGDRFTPLEIYGPSGTSPDLGLEYAIEGMKQYTNWNVISFKAALPESDGFDINVHELDYTLNPGVAYDKNGVVITHFPGAHSIDGAISYRLDWNGLCVIIPTDTNPTTWDIENGMNCDLILHEVGPSPEIYAKNLDVPVSAAQMIVDSSHTSPKAFGKIFSQTQPRLAVVTHTVENADTIMPIIDDIRIYYDGPLAVASDMTVFNISKDEITQRTAIGPDLPWTNTLIPTPDTAPSLDIHDYKTQNTFDHIIPKCEDATDGQLCY